MHLSGEPRKRPCESLRGFFAHLALSGGGFRSGPCCAREPRTVCRASDWSGCNKRASV